MSNFDASIELQASDEELIKSFKNLQTFYDVCNILEVSTEHLHYILFKMKNKYQSFTIIKKNGDERQILAPCKSLKILQKKINYILSLIYKPKYFVNGFVKNRSIVTNAKKHLNKKNLLNIDLENFFPSINFGRVRGIFISLFNIGKDAATILANICCHNNSLPQGAPTSPIISNIICFHLDRQLHSIAKQHSCIYTRYADDITFSIQKSHFPKEIAYRIGKEIILSEMLTKTIEDNGFKINRLKTRLVSHFDHMEVTGITVNEKLNVKRNYIKKIRTILKSLETNSLEEAQKIFEEKYSTRNLKNKVKPKVLNVLFGMINFVGMVKGYDDLIFNKLALRYNNIVGSNVFEITITDFSLLWEKFIYVVEVGIQLDDEFIPIEQGTGFLLKDVGFVTCSHVIKKIKSGEADTIFVHRSRYSKTLHKATVITDDEDRDVAILQVIDIGNSEGFKYNIDHNIGQNITLLGYPNFGEDDSLYTFNGQIVQYRSHFMKNKYNEMTGDLGVKQERTVISPRIVVGNSGGPIINTQNEVIGIAAKGFENISESENDDSTADNIIVKVQDVIELFKEYNILLESANNA